MAVENRSSAAGAINAPPSNSDTYTSRGVFNNTGTSAGVSGTSGSSTSQTTVNPSGGGTGGDANDTTITLEAGTGLMATSSDGTTSFTTNQATPETITFALNTAGAGAATYPFDSTNILTELQVDQYGRVISVMGSSVAPPNPFRDNLQTSATFAGGAVPARNTVAGVEMDTPITAQIMVDASDYEITNVDITSTTGIMNAVATIDSSNRNIANITGTVPANTAGPVNLSTRTTVRRESTMDVETQDSMPIDTELFVPYYTFGPSTETTTMLDFSNPIDISAWTPSAVPLMGGGASNMLEFMRSGGETQFIYWALEDVTGRTYMQNLGFGNVNFMEVGLQGTGTRLGRTFQVFGWPTNNEQDVIITFN